MTNTRIPLGQVVITPNALEKITRAEALQALKRHETGDFGDLSEGDLEANMEALERGEQLLSAYNSKDGIRFWIVTEHDRSVTTIPLPEDY